MILSVSRRTDIPAFLFGLVLQPDPGGAGVRPESDEPASGQQNPAIPRCD